MIDQVSKVLVLLMLSIDDNDFVFVVVSFFLVKVKNSRVPFSFFLLSP